MAATADRFVLVLVAATLLSGVSAVQRDLDPAAAPEVAAGCVAPCTPERDAIARRPVPVPAVQPSARPARPRPATRVQSPRPRATSRTPLAPKPKPVSTPSRPAPRRVQLKRVPATVDPVTATAIGRMRLTPAGYRAFLDAVDQSSFDYAQTFIEFDPARVPIEQRASEVFVWHFTAFYRNADGPSSTAAGDMAVRPFVQGLAERGDDSSPADHVCCGVNWVIDRLGPAHQLAPVSAKLRHNPPYDSVNTGVEVEAARQVDITTEQYESLAYLTVAVLRRQELLGSKPMSELAKGHGEMRDAYLEQNPSSSLDSRDDFNAPESALLRQGIERFLRAYPQVTRTVPQIR